MDAPKHPSVTDTSLSDDMHTLTRHQIDLDAASPELLAWMEEGRTLAFRDWLAKQQQACEQYLVENGWPAPGLPIIHDGVTWRARPEDVEPTLDGLRNVLRPGERLTQGATFIRKTAAPFSHAWFALRLFEAARDVRRLEPSDRDWAIFKLGHLFSTARSRALFGSVTKAKKNPRDARAGGIATGAATRERTGEILAEMQALVLKGHSVTRAADLVARRGLGTSAAANRKLWSRHS